MKTRLATEPKPRIAVPRARPSLDRQHARPQLRNVRPFDARACRERGVGRVGRGRACGREVRRGQGLPELGDVFRFDSGDAGGDRRIGVGEGGKAAVSRAQGVDAGAELGQMDALDGGDAGDEGVVGKGHEGLGVEECVRKGGGLFEGVGDDDAGAAGGMGRRPGGDGGGVDDDHVGGGRSVDGDGHAWNEVRSCDLDVRSTRAVAGVRGDGVEGGGRHAGGGYDEGRCGAADDAQAEPVGVGLPRVPLGIEERVLGVGVRGKAAEP
jgi:hypothetical protein